MLILIPTLVLWISDPKFIFEQISAKKVKIVHFAWKLVLMLSRGCCFLSNISFLNFENLNPLLGKFGPKNSKLFSLGENWHTECLHDVHSYYRHYFSQFQTLNLFLDKFGSKNSNLFILTENWHAWYIEDADSYSDKSFLNCQPEIHLWENLG